MVMIRVRPTRFSWTRWGVSVICANKAIVFFRTIIIDVIVIPVGKIRVVPKRKKVARTIRVSREDDVSTNMELIVANARPKKPAGGATLPSIRRWDVTRRAKRIRAITVPLAFRPRKDTFVNVLWLFKDEIVSMRLPIVLTLSLIHI